MDIILKDKGYQILYKNRFIGSMRFRLLISIFLLTLIPLLIFSYFLLQIVEDNMVNQKLEKLRNQTTVLRNHMMAEGYVGGDLSDKTDIEIAQLSNLYSGRVQVTQHDLKIIKDTFLVDEGKTNISEGVLACFKGENQFEYNENTGIIEGNMAILSADSSQIIGVINISFSTDEVDHVVEKIKSRVFALEMLVLVAALAVAIVISGIMVRPFKKIEESIERISQGNFKEKISIRGYYETEQITDAFNQMLDKFNEIDESRSEFVSNVSHELKTPIASIKVLSESLLSQDNIPEAMYKEFLTDIVNEVDRENDIVQDLLTLVRLDKQADTLKVEQINVNEMVEQILKRLKPIAAQKNIELVFESFRPVIAELDQVKMSIVINNLVENAIKYNILDGWVHISLNADHKYMYLKVSDSGLGIPEDDQARVFDRFYRVDKSRTRDGNDIGGTGLGLAITKNIVLMHRGAIKVYSKENEGSTFTVRIPLTYLT